jgi:hypothetical protein
MNKSEDTKGGLILRDDNFSSWKYYMQAVLQSKKVWHTIDRSSKEEVTAEENAKAVAIDNQVNKTRQSIR